MMKHSNVKNFLFGTMLLISTTSLFAQKLEPKKRITEADTTLISKITGKDYQLYISFPRGYTTKDTTRYPVLYVLDGLYSFPVFKAAREMMDLGKELENVILVGIGSGLDGASWYANRVYDYTPSKDTLFDRNSERQIGFPKGFLKSGGAELFLKCITTEIIPYVDRHYKTTNDRGISGHSLGGLFATYCLFNSKGIFTRFGINSPALWWNDQEILNQAASLMEKNESWDQPYIKIFVSAGQEEGPKMLPDVEKLGTLFESKAYKNVSFTWKVFEEETHLSIIPAGLSRTLTVLYGRESTAGRF